MTKSGSDLFRRAVLTLFILSGGAPAAWSRSWSYHYHPGVAAAPTVTNSTVATPLSPPRFSPAQLLKQTIVSDLAVYALEQNGGSVLTTDDDVRRLLGLLASFDRLNSADDLRVFSALGGYYLGASAEALYDCLALRKGPALELDLEQAIQKGNAECVRDLGQQFIQPSAGLGGHALCTTSSEEIAHLTALAAEIGAAKSCSDRELDVLIADARHHSRDVP